MKTEILEHKGFIIQPMFMVTFPGNNEVVYESIEEANKGIEDYLQTCGMSLDERIEFYEQKSV